MTRSQIDELSQNLIFLINEMEDVLMKKIAAQLVSDGDISDSSKWRIRQLARAGKLDKEALKTIKSYMSAQSEMLEDALYNAAVSEIGNVDEMVKDAATRGLVDGRVKAPADRTAQSALKSYLKQAKSDLNMVNTVMRYKTKQAYVSAVNNTFWTLDKEQRVHDALGMGALEVISGAESFQTAVRDVLKKLSERGIPAFIDAGGHEWKPETYVQMDLRTTMGNTARAAQWQRCDDFGVDLIEVDSHLGAREKCARDQGKIYSRSGQSGTCRDGSGNVVYYYAFSSTSFGQPDGLFGINCRHNSYPYIPGVSYQRYFPIDEAENAKRYKEYQTQRALERKIRESKRECMLLSEAGDEEGLKKAALTLRNRKENYRAYSKAHDLRVHNDRTQVYGYDRSKSMKTVWAEKKAQNGGSSAPAPSGGKAVTVNAPAPASSGKAYTGEKITKPLDNGGGSGIMKERKSDINNARIGITDSSSTAPINNSTKIGSQLFTEDNYKIMLQHERIISGNNYETAIIYYPDGSVNFKKKGSLDTVKFTANERKKMNGCVATHNHPNGTVQSPDDIMMLRTVNLSEIRACNSKGAYVVTPPSKWSKEIDSLEKLSEKYLDYYEAAMSKYRDVSAQEGKPLFLYLKTAEEEGLRDFCERYGFGYRWEEI